MSLIAHYPLDSLSGLLGGDLTYENNSGKLSLAPGRLGSGYKRSELNTGGDFLQSTQMFALPSSFTMSCWAYVTAAGTSANGLVTHHSHDGQSGAGITVKRVSDNDYRISCNTGDGSSRTYNSYYGTSNIKNRWSHLTVRYDAGKREVSLWVDGICEKIIAYTMKTESNHICIHSWSTTYNQSSKYRPVATIDDVRIYNNALSGRSIYDLSMQTNYDHKALANALDLYVQSHRVKRLALGRDVLYRSFSEVRRSQPLGPSDLFSNPDPWSNDGGRGFFLNTYNDAPVPVDALNISLESIRRIEAKFTSHHNTPDGGMGKSTIIVELDDGAEIEIGTNDAWTSPSVGHSLQRPNDQGGNISKTLDPFDQVLIWYSVPLERTVVGLSIHSHGFSDSNTTYPFGERGIKDLVVTELVF